MNISVSYSLRWYCPGTVCHFSWTKCLDCNHHNGGENFGSPRKISLWYNQVFLLVSILVKFSWDCVVYHRTGKIMINIKIQWMGVRSIAVGGAKSLLQRPRNLSSSLQLDLLLLLLRCMHLLLLKFHLQMHLLALQSHPKPPQCKGVRKLSTVWPLIVPHPGFGRACRVGLMWWEWGALATSPHPTPAIGGILSDCTQQCTVKNMRRGGGGGC